MKLGAWLAGLLVVWSTVASAEAPPSTAEAPRTIDELRAEISGILVREQVPGAGIALI